MIRSVHVPVLLKEGLQLLNIDKGTYVDCTLGGGGYTLAIASILEKKGGGRIISLDVDINAIENFEKYLKAEGWQRFSKSFQKGAVEIIAVRANFDNLSNKLKKLGIQKVDGIIVDLGLSLDQIEDSNRGFSYMKDGPLDMRMDDRLKVTAADILNALREKELVRLFQSQDEKFAKRIAHEIIVKRAERPIKTTLHLVKIIKKVLPFQTKDKVKRSNKAFVGLYWKKPVMRVFQALRIAVNLEFDSLRKMLPQALVALAPGKSLVVISFHSGEDRLVKNVFKSQSFLKRIEILTKRPIRPGIEEVRHNAAARSAKLRACRKL